MKLLMKSQMKAEKHSKIVSDAMNECAVNCEVGIEGSLSRNKAERA